MDEFNKPTTTSGQDVGAQVETLRRDLSELTERMSRYMDEQTSGIGETVSRGARQARRALNERLNAAGLQTDQISEMATQKAGELQEQVENYVVENPLRAVAIAAGVGLLIGAMSRR